MANAPKANAPYTLAQRLAFMKLSLEERRRILAEQAKQMVRHYEQDSDWREVKPYF